MKDNKESLMQGCVVLLAVLAVFGTLALVLVMMALVMM